MGALANITSEREIPSSIKEFYLARTGMDGAAFDRGVTFLESRFSNVNGAVLTLVGDLEENYTRKMLCESVGAFRADRTKALKRTSVGQRKMPDFPPEAKGLVVTFPYHVTSSSFFTMYAAAEALRTEIVKRVAPLGYYADVTPFSETYPEERIHFLVTLGKASPEGMPEPVAKGDAVDGVKKAIFALAADPVSKKDATLYKNMVRSRINAALWDNDTWRDLIDLRYISSKDFVSTRKESIESITPERMRFMFFAASSGKITEL